MYAIVRTGGKQYRVEEGRSITIERLPAAEGETVELTDVLLIADNGTVTVGAPVIEGARVLAEVEANGRGKKIIVFKYKSKTRARKKTGHRQNFTKLSVTEILAPGQQSKVKPKRARRPKAEEEAVEAPEAEVEVETPEAVAAPEVEAAVEAPETEAIVEAPAVEPPKPRARRAAPAEKPETKSKARKAPEPKAKAAKPPKAAKEEKPKRGKAEKKDDKPKAPRRRLPLPRRKKDTEK
jgi:large subunit ribosomal protein L21